MEKKNLIALLEESVQKYSNWTFMMEYNGSEYAGSTFKEIYDEAHNVAGFLLSKGIKKGDRAALLSEGRNAWVSAEFGIFLTGGISVPLSVKIKTREELLFRLKHSSSRFLIVSDRQWDKTAVLIKELPSLEFIVIIGNHPGTTDFKKPEIYSWNNVLAQGSEYNRDNPDKLKQSKNLVSENDPATLTYTSGTTAEPKGIVLSHKNYWVNVEDVNTFFKLPIPFYTLLILPWDHSFAHTAGLYSFLKKGSVIGAVEPGKTEIGTIRNIPKNIKEIRPTYLLVVPALAESFRRSIEKKIEETGGFAEKLFNLTVKWGIRVLGDAYHKRYDPLSLVIWPFYLLLRAVISKQIKSSLGGRIRFMVCGGSALSVDHVRWFAALGLPVYQGYGLSETSPVVSSNFMERKHFKIGSSGKLFPWVKIQIADENDRPLPPGKIGEVTLKGDCVMIGYWNNKSATDESMRNGWFHTGDLGYMDKDGFLFITGRIKSLLVGEDGEKYSPEALEQHLTDNNPVIKQIMLYNQQNPYTVALIVPDRDKALRLIKEKTAKDTEQITDEKARIVLEHIENILKKYKTDKKLSSKFMPQWVPKTFALLPEEFSENNGMINSTLKMVRRKIVSAYMDRIEGLYSNQADPFNPINIESLKNWLSVKRD